MEPDCYTRRGPIVRTVDRVTVNIVVGIQLGDVVLPTSSAVSKPRSGEREGRARALEMGSD